ncbi:MAG: hypothetical protein R8K46_08080 [Mariprofundaceae bacterium]
MLVLRQKRFAVKSSLWLVSVITAYAFIFMLQESHATHEKYELEATMSAEMQLATLGYFRQLGAEMLHIKSAVFLGGVPAGVDHEAYVDNLAEHFDAASTLHPKLLDTYYLAESSLSWINDEGVRRANRVLEKGIRARPDQWVLPFFMAFNSFYYQREYGQAAEQLQRAAAIEGAPRWIGHLASVIAGRGGDIHGGLIWLRAMRMDEEDPEIKKRYDNDIKVFERALTVQQALEKYDQRHGALPLALDQLVPEFMATIPDIGPEFNLTYEDQSLRVVRP